MSDNEDKNLIQGHEYDGIQELNNPLPNWWVAILVLTIAFAIGYYGYYELGSGPSSDQILESDMAAISEQKAQAAPAQAASFDVASVDIKAIIADPSKLKIGQDAFVAKCAACHAGDGGGSIGPNLVDEYWVNGGSVADIFKVVSEGILSKGMPAWKDLLSQDERLFVTAFIVSIKGQDVAQAKAPQGDKFEQ